MFLEFLCKFIKNPQHSKLFQKGKGSEYVVKPLYTVCLYRRQHRGEKVVLINCLVKMTFPWVSNVREAQLSFAMLSASYSLMQK